ncbi:conserved hypothetical protein [Alkaliphilus metalliredigens QYMF]|uniref:Putative amidase domain-containing protein n=1 Tax=Alkaliphilus metalliredigens (strain QYMF) TaxID=293826 RepID=A6TUF5_ALKMQ|nr:amidase domain-containing protein [Alkaliphilus metalliredigens]ABR49823.1 conserved hypothetical protein [Alkaliphilus metalliredigens QYMF]
MFIVIKLKSLLVTLLIAVFLITFSLSVYLWSVSIQTTTSSVADNLDRQLTSELQKIFQLRNQALIEYNTDMLASLYNQEVRNGLWAYEHELTKLKYLHNWSDKQAIEFKEIDSHIVIRSFNQKNDGFSLNLLVSTAYTYTYKDTPQIHNSFRIGAYHSLDLMPHEEDWVITREWYTDPFADSLHLDEIKSQEIQQVILSGETKDLSDLNQRRVNALAYANQYAGAASLPEYDFQYNSKYRNYNPEGGNCANFASQILYEGGGFKKNRTWNYERGAGSSAWINAHSFNSYMLSSGRASTIARGAYDEILKVSYKLLPGDYIAYEKKGKVTHISVVTGLDSKGYILVNSNNSDRYQVPWDLGWSDKSIKFHLVHVHY